MKKLMTLLVALTIVAIASFSDIAADNIGPEEVKLEASMGTVTFQHRAHQSRVDDCVTCHHEGVEAGACSSCHDAKPEVPRAKTVFHQLCKSCHKTNDGPTKCKGCHVKE